MQKTPYLKKKKMYELLKGMLEYKPDLMKYATYKFYQGAEWLEGSAYDGENVVIYKMYHAGYFLSLDIGGWSEEKCDSVEIERITYHLKNEKWIKTYQRTEAYQKTEEIKKWLDSLNSNVNKGGEEHERNYCV